MYLYKICTKELWAEAQKAKKFTGTPFDVADGFVHLSTLEQSAATVRKYFRGQSGLVMLTVDSDKFAGELRWEKSLTGRRGDFPHLYGYIPFSAIVEATPFDAPE